MEITRTLFPFGQLQGFPAMVVDCTGAKPEQLEALPRLVRANMRPADDLLWLGGVDWSLEATEQMLVELASHERTSGVSPVALRELGAEGWPSTQCYWILDVSILLREPTSPDEVRARTQDLPYFPDVDELICRLPHPENLTPAVWDELLNWITPTGPAWAYVRPVDYPRASDCMFKAAHRAGVRPLFDVGGELDAVWSSHPPC